MTVYVKTFTMRGWLTGFWRLRSALIQVRKLEAQESGCSSQSKSKGPKPGASTSNDRGWMSQLKQRANLSPFLLPEVSEVELDCVPHQWRAKRDEGEAHYSRWVSGMFNKQGNL